MPDTFTPKAIAIVGGGGVMGHGIALACLQGSECEVRIIARRPETVEHGLRLIRTGPYGLDRAVERGKLSQDRANDLKSRISGTTDYETGLAGVDLVFESVPEVVSTKHEVLRRIEQFIEPNAIIASNTSAIMITELAAALDRPQRLVGTHWFYPANVMKLVEMAVTEIAAGVAVESVATFLAGIGKLPIRVKDSPGFFMTRFINNFIAEAIRLVELGITGPAEIDLMVKSGLGWPMGVFELLDKTANFDAWYHAQDYLAARCGDRYLIPPLAHRVLMAGYLGAPALKPGSRGGWYDFLKVSTTDQA